MKELQCAEWHVNEQGTAIVDRAMTGTGGSGYLAGHPLSRLYRDARAGSFMQTFSPLEAPGYIGAVTLGATPTTAVDRGTST